jgi:hypothetical protein
MLGPSTSGKLQRTSGCVNDAASEGSPCTDTFADAPVTEELALGAGLCALGCPPPLVHAADNTTVARTIRPVQRIGR